jgi:3-oxoacyl-[acyl-carrier-protein] synthase II
MKAPKNRKVYVVGCALATPLGFGLASTWARAVRGEAGFRKVTRCLVDTPSFIVGEIPDWNPRGHAFVTEREIHYWNAAFVLLTMAIVKDALDRAHVEIDGRTGPRTAVLIGSALNGHDAFRIAAENLRTGGPNKVSPFLLPNLCANVPSGKAGIVLGFTGPVFSPQGACASGNHAIALGARMIRDGDADFAVTGGVEMPLLPEIVHGFANMNATLKLRDGDRAMDDPSRASRPFSADRRGFVLAEGAAALVLAADEAIVAHGLDPIAEILGVGWTSDAHHITAPHSPTIIRAMREALDDAAISSEDIQYVNAHGTSTLKGDASEIECLREVFGARLERIPISSNKSQVGHSLGAAAAIEAVLTVEGLVNSTILPTANHLPDPAFGDLDFVPNEARRLPHEIALSNAFGFGGTNCCVVFRGV